MMYLNSYLLSALPPTCHGDRTSHAIAMPRPTRALRSSLSQSYFSSYFTDNRATHYFKVLYANCKAVK